MADQPPSHEFELIARLFAPLAAGQAGAFGLTDDAAVMPCGPGEELVVTTDLLVAGIHFLPDYAPDLVARKLLRVNLSDLAAMGANARAYTLGLALPREISDDWLERFAQGLASDQAEFGVGLIGGDTVATEGPLVLSLSAYGVVEPGTALRRAGARQDDRIFVTGTIGDAALGLSVLKGTLALPPGSHRDHLVGRYRVPQPRLAFGPRLVGIAHAAIDVSDGLVADLGHICETSGLGARIEAARLPLSSAARTALAQERRLIETVLTGGDDYELLFCVAQEDGAAVAGLAAELSIAATEIGVIRPDPGVVALDEEGREMALASRGYQHF